ncbi:hypothetical protein BX589_103374 [Paraburkholderia fungorum]|jgi:nucleoid DNA-binding protein|nr:hypothetical protein BX589_103374 [Paraburkholderia fungorum]
MRSYVRDVRQIVQKGAARIQIAAAKTVKFTAGKAFRDAVNASKW